MDKTVIPKVVVNNLRTGKKYRIVNNREEINFEVVEVLASNDYLVKDLSCYEKVRLSVFFSYGVGRDFEFEQINN